MAFTCADAEQAVVWLLRTDAIGTDGMIDRTRPAAVVRVSLPGLARGRYSVFYWDTEKGRAVRAVKIEHSGTAALSLEPPPFAADLAIAVRKL